MARPNLFWRGPKNTIFSLFRQKFEVFCSRKPSVPGTPRNFDEFFSQKWPFSLFFDFFLGFWALAYRSENVHFYVKFFERRSGVLQFFGGGKSSPWAGWHFSTQDPQKRPQKPVFLGHFGPRKTPSGGGRRNSCFSVIFSHF